MIDASISVFLEQGPDDWNRWRQKNHTLRPNLDRAHLNSKDLTAFNFSKVSFVGANLGHATLTNADLSKANLGEAFLRGARLEGANLRGATVKDADFTGAVFTKSKLDSLVLKESILTDADFSESSLNQADLSALNLPGVRFVEACARGANFEHTNLRSADFTNADIQASNFDASDLNGANLRGAKLNDANLQNADLSGAQMNSSTLLTGAITDGCTVDRFQLERLKNYGGLTVGDRMVMNIVDGVARLRSSYSGFWQWFHLFALGVFVFPYGWFIAVQWSQARFLLVETETHIALWKALAIFIFNGGVNWQSGPAFHWSFLAFLFLTFYNVLRGILLWKTKQLELQQQSSGLPPMFSLRGSSWGKALTIANWSTILYLLIALANTAHFFTQEIPLDQSNQRAELSM